jgi:hypothetical protein
MWHSRDIWRTRVMNHNCFCEDTTRRLNSVNVAFIQFRICLSFFSLEIYKDYVEDYLFTGLIAQSV